MDKQSTLPKNSEASFEETWAELPAVQWAIANGKQIAYWALIAVLLLFTAYRFLASAAVKNEQEFIAAEGDMAALAAGNNAAESLNKLNAILKSHPELHAKYDGAIAQALITQNDLSGAAPYADRTFARTDTTTPAPYLSYSRTTLTIAQGNLSQALKEAEALKAHVEYPALYAFNVLRIALLQKELKLPDQEKATWDEIKQLAQGSHPVKMPPAQMRLILSHFNTQGIPLESFIR